MCIETKGWDRIRVGVSSGFWHCGLMFFACHFCSFWYMQIHCFMFFFFFLNNVFSPYNN